MDTLGPLAILRGLAVTHVATSSATSWGFIRGKPTIFTVQYPEELQQLSPAFRGMPVLVQMDNGKERCVACGLCEWACPTDCITIYPAETADEIERYPEVFDIDMSRCMFCGLCEEACPEEAIVMSQRVEIADHRMARAALAQAGSPGAGRPSCRRASSTFAGATSGRDASSRTASSGSKA